MKSVVVIEGTISNGTVVLDDVAAIPNGTRVTDIVPVDSPKAATPENGEPTLHWLLKHAGVIDDMPSDFAAQHDHYIHGTPKR